MEVKIWGVVEGPISIEEIKDPEDLDYAPEGSKYFMVCKRRWSFIWINLSTN